MSERRAIDSDPLGGHHLCLTVQGQVPGVLRDHNVGDERLGRQTAFDQTGWSRRLDDAGRVIGARPFAGPAGILRSSRHDHPELRRDLVEPFRAVLADDVQISAAARAGLGLWLDDGLLARQMRGQVTAIDTPLPRARRCQRRVGLLHTGLPRGNRSLQVLESEIELVLAQALGLAPEVIAAELTQHVQQALVVIGEPSLLATLGDQHRLQLLDVVGQIVDRIVHAEQHVRQRPPASVEHPAANEPVTRIIGLPAAPARGACAPAPNRGPPEARRAAPATDA